MTVFADEIDRVRPTIIFGDKGLRISVKEKKVMTDESRSCINTIGQNSNAKILIADVHHE